MPIFEMIYLSFLSFAIKVTDADADATLTTVSERRLSDDERRTTTTTITTTPIFFQNLTFSAWNIPKICLIDGLEACTYFQMLRLLNGFILNILVSVFSHRPKSN